jgi:hypothetical protein
VKDRANAVVQWLLAAEKDPEMVKGAWVLMLESDYVFRKPVQVRLSHRVCLGGAVMGAWGSSLLDLASHARDALFSPCTGSRQRV